MHGKHGKIKAVFVFAAVAFCELSNAQVATNGLKDYYQSYFPIGVAVSPQVLTGPEGELIKKNFNSLTAENVMKMGPIHPEENRFNWEPADQVIYGPTAKEVAESITTYSSLGLKLQITELDVSVYAPEQGRRDKKPDEKDSFTPEMESKQAEFYSALFRVFRENKKVISGVTFWNVSDKRSWLDNFPVRSRKNYPLLFDQELKPKKAYQEVVQFK